MIFYSLSMKLLACPHNAYCQIKYVYSMCKVIAVASDSLLYELILSKKFRYAICRFLYSVMLCSSCPCF